MAKKKSKNKELPKEFSAEDIEAGLIIAHKEYLMNVLSLLSFKKDGARDVSYVRCPVTTPDGGLYLVSILHVEGPKVNLDNLGAAADKSIEDSKK